MKVILFLFLPIFAYSQDEKVIKESLYDNSRVDSIELNLRELQFGNSRITGNQTITGNTLYKSTFTVQSNSHNIILSTNTYTDSLKIDGSNGNITILGNLTVNGAISYTPKRYIAVDSKAHSTDGGSFASGSWQTRYFNTETVDDIGVTLTTYVSSATFTFPAGTYFCRWSAPAFGVDTNTTQLYNLTASAQLVLGGVAYGNNNQYDNVYSIGAGRFTLAVQSTISLQHICETTKNTFGFGNVGAVDLGVNNIFSILDCVKE